MTGYWKEQYDDVDQVLDYLRRWYGFDNMPDRDERGHQYDLKYGYVIHIHDFTLDVLRRYLQSGSGWHRSLVIVDTNSPCFYCLRVGGWPSMCGGRTLLVSSGDPAELLNPARTSLTSGHTFIRKKEFKFDPVTDLFNVYGAGIFTSFISNKVVSTAAGWRVARFVNELFEGMKDVSEISVESKGYCSKPRWDTNRRLCNLVWIAHYCDSDAHDGADEVPLCVDCGEVAWDHPWCDYCEREVDVEYAPSRDEDEDAHITSVEDWFEQWSLELTEGLEFSKFTSAPNVVGLSANGQSCDSHKTVSCVYATNWDVRTSPLNPDDILDNIVLNIVMHSPEFFTGTPCQISTNVGAPSYRNTAKVMGYLWTHREALKEKMHIHVISPENFATNPNERDHYIHSMALVYDPVGEVVRITSDLFRDGPVIVNPQQEAA